MTDSVVFGLLALQIDVGAHDTVQIAPPNDDTNAYTSLVHAFEVVRSPCERVWYGRINTHRSEESASILDLRVRTANQHAKPNDADGDGDHIAVASPSCPVCHPTRKDGQRCSTSVGWDRKKLSLCAGIAHGNEDSRQKERE